MMKNVGLAVLAIGVSLAAAYGARLGGHMRGQSTVRGRAEILSGAEHAAFGAYCKARKEAGLPLYVDEDDHERGTIDGCPDPEAAPPAPEPDSHERPSEPELVAAGRARLAGLREQAEEMPGAVRETRDAWLTALEASIEPGAAAAVIEVPKPEARLSEWFGESGMPFLAGLLLVVVGAVIGRVAVRREATAEGDAKKGKGEARDFGAMLADLRDAVQKLADEMGEEDRRDAHERLKEEIHTLTLDQFEPLIDARARVLAKYGMAGFAEIFGPLSSAERHVNRAWSALVDDHWPEARTSVHRAAEELHASHDQLTSLMKR